MVEILLFKDLFFIERICLALAALEPVVYDLFLVRVKNDNKELDAQRLVIVQILLKLVRYNKVKSLFTFLLLRHSSNF